VTKFGTEGKEDGQFNYPKGLGGGRWQDHRSGVIGQPHADI